MYFRLPLLTTALITGLIIGGNALGRTPSHSQTAKKNAAKTTAKKSDETTKTAETTGCTTKTGTTKVSETAGSAKPGATKVASAKESTPASSAKGTTKSSAKTAKSPKSTDKTNSANEKPETPMVLVKEAKASLYPKPEKGCKAQASLTKWAPLEVKGQSGDYIQVETDEGVAGYVSKSCVSQSPYVSIGGNQVNVRSGPGNDDLVLFSLKNHYPVQVVEKKGSRVHIKDYEGDNGWLHESLLSLTPYVIVNQKEINARVTPGADASGKATGKIAFIAPKGVIFKLLETDAKTGWLHIKHEDGSDGWVSPKLVWGGTGR